MVANTAHSSAMKGEVPACVQILFRPWSGCLVRAAQRDLSQLVEELLMGDLKSLSSLNRGRIRHRWAEAVPYARFLVVTCPYAGLWGWTWACGPLSGRSLLGEFMPHSLLGNGCQGCLWGWGRSELAWFFSLRRKCRVGWMNLGGPPKRRAGQ